MTAPPIRILILAANPWNTNRLDLGEEYQRIQDSLDESELKNQFELKYHPALRAENLLKKVLEFKPHLIHFSGHGEADSLIFTDLTGDKAHEVTKQALADLFKLLAPDLKAVFLNACYSATQAEEIVEQVDYVIGMNAAINDLAAISFSQGFYTAIFRQNTLDIEQAFAAGLSQMNNVNISATERQKPELQKRPKTYVPSYKHDVFISFADADTQWATNFISYLQKQLKSKLATSDGFQLCINNDFSQLESSAMLLIIASPAYCQQYACYFEQLGTHAQRHLIEMTSYSIPDSLKGVSRQKFWFDDEQQGIVSLQGAAHIDKANQVAELVAKQLQELRIQHEGKKRLEDDIKAKEDKSASILASVFLNSAPEDLELTHHIKSLLKKNGVNCVLVPMERTDKLSSKEIRDDIENKISGCDAVLVLCEQTTAVWANKQIIDCQRLQRKRETPFKIIAIHRGKDQPDLGIDWDLLKTYDCPPKQVEAYLQEFIGALI